MVSNGGSDGNRSDDAPVRRLALALGFMAAIALLSLGAMDIGRITAGQRISRQAATECQAKSDRDSCQSSLASVRSAIASEDAVNLAIWQTVLNAFGLAGLFLTVFYAAKAWQESKRSADADNAALEETRRSFEEARRDAAEQARRFDAQLETAARSAEAVTRQAEIAEDTARKHLRAYLYASKMIFFWPSDKQPIFSITLNNTGLTPATNVRLSGRIILAEHPNTPDFPQMLTSIREVPIGGNTSEEVVIWMNGSETMVKSEMSRANSAYIFGVIGYEDVYGFRYESRFGFCATGPICPESGLSKLIGIDHVFVEVGQPKNGGGEGVNHLRSPL